MSTRMRDALRRTMGELRHEPTEKRIRAVAGGRVVVDSRRALLVWEPWRVVPCYAVPPADIRVDLLPGVPFSAHTTPGEPLALSTVRGGPVEGAAGRREGALRPADPDLGGYVILDFDAFDGWFEEEEALIAHPRDPYHRIDVRTSARHIRVCLDGVLLAESWRPVLVFETSLPTRFYLPRDDVRVTLHPSERRAFCAYKGEAGYWSTDVRPRPGRDRGGVSSVPGQGERRDVAWSYEAPLREAVSLTGLVCFFEELVDVTVDGERRDRPPTDLARSILDEVGLTGATTERAGPRREDPGGGESSD